MKFVKYSSIENSYRTAFLNKIKQEGKDKGQFEVQEKIHGANLSFWISKAGIKCASRTGFLEEGDKFYNYKKVLARYETELLNLLNLLNEEEISVYGELFGGAYPHSDVPKIQTSRVQKGVFYSNDVEFIAFDIKTRSGSYLPTVTARRYLNFCGIPVTEALFTGSLEECLAYPNEFQTTIPDLHGLPPIENNVCEGVVIRPVFTEFLSNHSRVIIKNKNAKFKEKSGESDRPKVPKPKIQLDPQVVFLREQVSKYIVENRLRNVISKIGTVTEKDFGKILGLFSRDIVEDFSKDEADFSRISKDLQKQVTKFISNEASNFIRPRFSNIIAGEF